MFVANSQGIEISWAENGVVGICPGWKKEVIYGVGPLGLLGPGRVELPADASAALSPWLTPPSWHINSYILNIIGLKIFIILSIGLPGICLVKSYEKQLNKQSLVQPTLSGDTVNPLSWICNQN